jgi:hypothetical protein
MLYGTTDKFLRVFGLSSLADLPETEALDTAAVKAEGVIIEEDKSQLTIDTTADAITSEEITPDSDVSPAEADGEEGDA